MNELQEVRTVDMVAAEIRALTSTMLSNIIEIGRRMCEAKEMVPHGQFGEWIKKNTGYSQSTANNFMLLYREYGASQGSLFGAETKSQTFGKLSYSKALALLAVPSEERESFAQANDIENKSVREIKDLIRERDEARRALEEAEEGSALAMAELEEQIEVLRARDENNDALSKQLREKLATAEQTAKDCRRVADELAAENEELRNRPIEVAVEVDEEAVKKAAEDARAAADAEWGKKMKAAEVDAEKRRAEVVAPYEKQVKELSGKAAEVDKLREELAEAQRRRDEGIAPYEKEISALKKQLALSGPEMTAFKLRFEAWQQSYQLMMQALTAVPEDKRGNCSAAVQAVLAGWVAQSPRADIESAPTRGGEG